MNWFYFNIQNVYQFLVGFSVHESHKVDGIQTDLDFELGNPGFPGTVPLCTDSMDGNDVTKVNLEKEVAIS